MYARAKIGGFLHLSIGEEATIVGSARALREHDYLISTYRSHGHALVRGTPPEQRDGGAVRPRRRLLAAGAAARCTCSTSQRRFMGGYGIVGGNLPIAAGIGLAADYLGQRRGDAMHVRRRRLQPGHVRRDAEPRGAVAAAGRVHGHQQPVRHGHGARAPLGGHRPAAQGREPRRARACAATAWTCSTPTPSSAKRVQPRARGAPAAAGRGGHLPLPRPLDGRPGGVPHQGGGRALARARPDPGCSAQRLQCRGRARRRRAARRSTQAAIARVDAAVEFADASPFPAPESLYDDVYVLGEQVARLVLGRDDRRPRSARRCSGDRAMRAARRRATTRSPSS